MNIYRITRSYSYEGNGVYGGPVVWFHLFRCAAIRMAARLAQDFAGQETGRWADDDKAIVTRFTNPRNEFFVAVDVVPLNIWSPLSAIKRWIHAHCHWQNLNTKWAGHTEIPVGSILRHGRAWVHTRSGDNRERRDLFHLEWTLFSRRSSSWSLSFDVFDGDSERDILMAVSAGWLFSFYFILEDVIPRKWAKNHTWSHDTGITLMEGSLHLQLYSCGNDCYYCDGYKDHPKRWTGWSKWIDFRELLFGRNDYKSEVVETHSAEVPMPEATYPAKVEIHRDVWTRRRWPFRLFPRVKITSRIEVEHGVPVPGKGENSWDCGEDAIFSTGSDTPTVNAAVSAMVSSALRSRENYGGRNWRPSRQSAA